jgi:hypothetical protein
MLRAVSQMLKAVSQTLNEKSDEEPLFKWKSEWQWDAGEVIRVQPR